MIVLMITLCRRSALLMMAGLCIVAVAPCAQARTPYDAIVERNPFGLKPIPPPTAETNAPAATPPSKVVLTGITSMFGPSSKRVFLEITEQAEGGKGTPAPPKRPMLGEGDREGDIEVVSIDIERNLVKIRHGTVESELTFEVPKAAPATGPAVNVAANSRGANTFSAAAPTANQPIIISSSESRGGVTMAGGGGGFQGNAAGVTSYGGGTPMMAGNSGGISSYGGISPTGFGSPGVSGSPSLGSGNGLSTIPSRTIRTPTTAPAQNVDPQTQILLMEANRIRNDQINQGGGSRPGMRMPPLPPTPLSKELYGGGPPPLPGQR